LICKGNKILGGEAPNLCLCNDGTYDNNTGNWCPNCPFSCATCTKAQDLSIRCLTCVANRDISNSCRCIPGFYAKSMPDTSTLCTPCGKLCRFCSSLSD